MLIVAVRVHFKRQRPSVHLDANHLRAQAEGGREIDPAIAASASLGLEFHAVDGLAILKTHNHSIDANIPYRKIGPVRGNVRSETDRAVLRIAVQPKHAPQDGTDHHSCGPDLVRRTGCERLVIVSGKNFGEMAERAVAAEQRIGPEIGIGRERAMVAVFCNRSPTRKEGPDGTKMIARAVVDLRLPRDNPHAPIGLVIFRRQLRNGLVRMVCVRQTKPHGDRRQHARLPGALVVGLQGKCISLHLRRPEGLIERRFAALELRHNLLADVILADKPSKIGKSAQSLHCESCLVILILNWKQRSAFDPAMADAGILREALRVIG